jgi:hypothetical protein
VATGTPAPERVAQFTTEDVDVAAYIDPVVVKRPRYRFPDVGERGGAGTVSSEGDIEGVAIENIAFDQRAPAHELGVASREVVECDWQKTRRRERLAGVAADEADTDGAWALGSG